MEKRESCCVAVYGFIFNFPNIQILFLFPGLKSSSLSGKLQTSKSLFSCHGYGKTQKVGKSCRSVFVFVTCEGKFPDNRAN